MVSASPATSTRGGPQHRATVGILGGMGPLATVDFMHKLLLATPASVDQDHVPVVVSSIPQVPDRTAAFRGEGASPLSAMISSGQRLVAAGAEVLVMPCNTAHLWFDELSQALNLPMLHLVDAALDEVQAMAPGLLPPSMGRTTVPLPIDAPAGQLPDATHLRVGLLATDATLASGLYVNRAAALHRPLQWLLPTAREVLEWVMPGIAAVKQGQLTVGRHHLLAAASALHHRGADVLMLGCTEIPVVLDAQTTGLPVIDASAALARRTVAWSLGEVAAV